MKRLFTAVFLIASTLAVGSTTSAAKPVTFTEHQKHVTETFVDTLPCIGGTAEITTVANAVFHVTAAGIDDKGTPDTSDDEFIAPYHIHGTETGTFVADPTDPAVQTYTGHFVNRFNENSNRANVNGAFTFTVIGRGADGSRLKFHETAHFTMNAHGDITVDFDKTRCG
jgi:hypothetical protein